MKSVLACYLITAVFFLSCNTSGNNNSQSGSQQEINNGQPINCYKYASETDTIELKLIHLGQSITGTLVYKLREKDRNMGTIQGRMQGDILVADYTFQSEGVSSVRQ